MFFMKNEMGHEDKVNLRGGIGTLDLTHIVPPEMLHGAGTQFGILTIAPGNSIGVHAHTDNLEVYFVLDGEATVSDNDEVRVLKAGDAEMASDGNTHSLVNNGTEDIHLLAVILKDFTK